MTVVVIYIWDKDFGAKMASIWESFSGKRFLCCALTVLYSICNMVGRCIASIDYLSGIFTSKLSESATSCRVFTLISNIWPWTIGRISAELGDHLRLRIIYLIFASYFY